MELKEGMYCRSINGNIHKIKNKNEECIINMRKSEIKKASFNIIDLIEYEDLIKVTGYGETEVFIVTARTIKHIKDIIKYNQNRFEISIVTHERFKAEEYKVKVR